MNSVARFVVILGFGVSFAMGFTLVGVTLYVGGYSHLALIFLWPFVAMNALVTCQPIEGVICKDTLVSTGLIYLGVLLCLAQYMVPMYLFIHLRRSA